MAAAPVIHYQLIMFLLTLPAPYPSSLITCYNDSGMVLNNPGCRFPSAIKTVQVNCLYFIILIYDCNLTAAWVAEITVIVCLITVTVTIMLQ